MGVTGDRDRLDSRNNDCAVSLYEGAVYGDLTCDAHEDGTHCNLVPRDPVSAFGCLSDFHFSWAAVRRGYRCDAPTAVFKLFSTTRLRSK